MTRTVLLVAVLVASTALFVSTGAVPFSDGTDRVADSDIVMQPADGPNGRYAVIDGDGEIALLLTDENPDIESAGVPDGAVTPLDRVFTITYTGDLFARVWITDDAEDVRFYRGDDSDETLEGSGNAVTLGPNETVTVGLLVDTRGDHDVESASSFDVRIQQATPTPTTVETPPEPEDTTTEPTTPEPTTEPPSPDPEPTTQTPVETTQSPEDTPTTTTPGDTQTPTETPQPGGDTSTTETDEDDGTTTEAALAPPVDADTTPAPTTERDDAQPPAGGLPSEVGGFDMTVLVPAVSSLALVLFSLVWYRRRSGR